MNQSMMEKRGHDENGLVTAPMSVDTPWGKHVVVVGVVIPVLATIVTIARFSTRKMKRLRPGVDDWLILLALVRTTVINIALKQ